MLLFLLGGVRRVNHVYVLHLGRELLLTTIAPYGLLLVSLIVITWVGLSGVAATNLQGFLVDPGIPVGMASATCSYIRFFPEEEGRYSIVTVSISLS